MTTLTYRLDTNTGTFRPGHGERIVRISGAHPDPGPDTLPIIYLDSLAEESWFWTAYWQEMVRASDDDIAQGRIMTFETVDELIDELNR